MPKSMFRRRYLHGLGSAALLWTAGCVDRDPTPWYGLGAAVVESPPQKAQMISDSRAELDDLDHVQQAIEEAVTEGESQVETSREIYRETDELFRELPHLLVTGVRVPDDSPKFNTPADSIIPDFIRGQELVPVIFVSSEDSPIAVWPLHYELG